MPTVDTGDTTWVLVSAALVMLMTPGLAFFYGGLVRHKNVLSTVMHSFIIIPVVSLVWVLWGYSLAFGPDQGGFIGNLDWFGLRNVGMDPGPYSDTIPHQVFMLFQLMFAVITPALITGAFAERAKFSTFLVFTVLWLTFVYAPIAHWVWGIDGWLRELGTVDFAGGMVVHISSGVAALVAAFLFGRRVGLGREPMEPHDITYVVLGAALLWFGWFGFNAGSALTAGGLAGNAFVVTNTAAGAGAVTWLLMSWWFTKKPSVVGGAAGAVAGLASITPAAGFVGSWPAADGYLNIMPAVLIGVGGGAFCYLATRLRAFLRFDDALDVWAVHGVGGTWGVFATGIFAVAAVGGVGGVIDGEVGQLGKQLAGIGATWGYSFVVTLMILKVLDLVIGLRVSEDEELAGLDVSQHGERAYSAPVGVLSAVPAATPALEHTAHSRPHSTVWEERGGQRLRGQAAPSQEDSL
jgi:Amt family ammonium transporter